MLIAIPNSEFVLEKTAKTMYAPAVKIKFNPTQRWEAKKRNGKWYLTNKRLNAKIKLRDEVFRSHFQIRVNDNFLGALRITALALVAAVIVGLCISERNDAVEASPVEPTLQTESVTVSAPESTTNTEEPVLMTLTAQNDTEPTEEWLNLGIYELTAYCPCEMCCGYWATVRPLDDNGNPIVYTSTGAVAQAGTTIAVDPSVIPYGTTVKINDHIFIAQDTGGAIQGNRIDVYFDDHQAALEFGRQQAEVFVLITP